MRGKTKKATFNLHTDVLAALDEIVAQGTMPSKNALVEQALRKELNELRRQARQKSWQEGAKDTLLLKDVKDVEADFETADAETARLGRGISI
jgi:metal-responsive CopG/Arc/MetJ family transcriptional regulator